MSAREDGGRLRWAVLGEGVERVAAQGLRSGYRPHAHDAYVIGTTAAGVQRFRYRRVECAALPGEAFVLHPEERHDGRPGTPEGYAYHALYVAPHVVAAAAGGRRLPVVAEAVTRDAPLRAAIARALAAPAEAFAAAECVADLAAALTRLAGGPARAAPAARYAALKRVRERLHAGEGAPMAVLEAETGLSRYVIVREFRRFFGVSPSRYLIQRRLERVRGLIAAGEPLAATAEAAGFADQSHMSRHFLKTYGLSPGAFRASLKG